VKIVSKAAGKIALKVKDASNVTQMTRPSTGDDAKLADARNPA
jgi:hypothetical protein